MSQCAATAGHFGVAVAFFPRAAPKKEETDVPPHHHHHPPSPAPRAPDVNRNYPRTAVLSRAVALTECAPARLRGHDFGRLFSLAQRADRPGR